MRIKRKKGQALVETALVIPLLTFLLVGIGYFGSVITIQHNLTVAARYTTRIVSLESTKERIDREEGMFLLSKISPEVFHHHALDVLPNFDKSRLIAEPIPLDEIVKIAGNIKGKFEPILTAQGFAYVYKYTDKVKAYSTPLGKPLEVSQLQRMDVGVGNIFFGVKLKYRLKELDWMAKFLFRKQGVTIEATSMMPAELPLRMPQAGLMNINSGIFDIIRLNVDGKVSGAYQYEDLIQPPNGN